MLGKAVGTLRFQIHPTKLVFRKAAFPPIPPKNPAGMVGLCGVVPLASGLRSVLHGLPCGSLFLPVWPARPARAGSAGLALYITLPKIPRAFHSQFCPSAATGVQARRLVPWCNQRSWHGMVVPHVDVPGLGNLPGRVRAELAG